MPGASLPDVSMEVALLTEGVDRNDYGGTPGFWRLNVALLAEGVDRNFYLRPKGQGCRVVALLAEGVDRNFNRFSKVLTGVDRNSRPGRMQYSQPGRPPRGRRG